MANNLSTSGHTEQSDVPEKKNRVWLIGEMLNKITGSNLPSNRQVLGRYFQLHSNEKITIQASATITATEVMHLWEKARIPIQRKYHIINKIKALHGKWQSLQKNALRKTETQRNREQLFFDILDNLFDIAHADALTLVKTNEERKFLETQREKRRCGNLGPVNKKIPKQEKGIYSGVNNEVQRDKGRHGKLGPVSKTIPKEEKGICSDVNNEVPRDKGGHGNLGSVSKKIPKQEKGNCSGVNNEVQREKGRCGNLGSVNKNISDEEECIDPSSDDDQSDVPENKSGIWLIGETLNKITGYNLPSNRQVLGRYFQLHSNEKITIQASATTTATEVMHLWEKARIPIQRKHQIINKVKVLHGKWRGLQKTALRKTETQRNREQLFVNILDNLFDIAHADALTLVKTNEERKFLQAQQEKGIRGNMGTVSRKLAEDEDSICSSTTDDGVYNA